MISRTDFSLSLLCLTTQRSDTNPIGKRGNEDRATCVRGSFSASVVARSNDSLSPTFILGEYPRDEAIDGSSVADVGQHLGEEVVGHGHVAGVAVDVEELEQLFWHDFDQAFNVKPFWQLVTIHMTHFPYLIPGSS